MTLIPNTEALFVLEYTTADATLSFAVGKNVTAMKHELREEGALAFNDPVMLERLEQFPDLQSRFRAHLHALQA
ncbi:hypothetical protein [Deinococcus ficus]|uniref:Uncharacterized protein n=1 Tax=Deinococcus ficus TaxID=317577 RepID=A0A221T2Z9_9DEIO|nr:hypothetical protein [Deinococcus ficus]ASN83272.1 hypothetical protein DFI_18920 [Deinococcus ficus]